MVRLFVRGQLEGVIDVPELEKYTSGGAEYAILEDSCQELVCGGPSFRILQGLVFVQR